MRFLNLPFRQILLTCLHFILLIWPAFTLSSNGLEEEMTEILGAENLTGSAWMLLSPERGVETGAAGMRDNEAKIPFTADTRFHVGSVTKLLLATGILRMAS